MAAEWYKKQPKNRNFLSPAGFKLNLEKFEGTDFFCQKVNLPDISVPFTEVPTRFRSFPVIAGGGVTFGNDCAELRPQVHKQDAHFLEQLWWSYSAKAAELQKKGVQEQIQPNQDHGQWQHRLRK